MDVFTFSLDGELSMIALRATVLLAAAAALTLIFRKSAASTRHTLWTATFTLLLILPLASNFLPSWEMSFLPGSNTVQDFVNPESPATPVSAVRPVEGIEPVEKVKALTPIESIHGHVLEILAPPNPQELVIEDSSVGEAKSGFWGVFGLSAAPNINLLQFLFWAWILGSAVSLLSLAVSLLKYRLLVRNSLPIDDIEWYQDSSRLRKKLGIKRSVELQIGPDIKTPMTGGWSNPVILLPEDAKNWSRDRRQAVLAHELIHVQRYDVLRQIIGRASLSLYWFHPLGWLAAKESVSSRELACDEAVLALGIRPSAYATHLLELAEGLNTRPSLATLPMVQKSQLEKRIMHILKPNRPRTSSLLSALALVLLTAISLTAAIAGPEMTRELVTADPLLEAPSISPIAIEDIRAVTSNFGRRLHPISKTFKHHDGIDISANKGVKVLSTASGQIRFAAKDGKRGKHIIVNHDEEYSTAYSHLNSIEVKEGDIVELGEVIGTVGSTGESRGDHLHYEVHKEGNVVDPRGYLEMLNGKDLGELYRNVLRDSDDLWQENMDRLAELKNNSEKEGAESFQDALLNYSEEIATSNGLASFGPQDPGAEFASQLSSMTFVADDKNCDRDGRKWQGTRTVSNGDWSESTYGNGQDITIQKVEDGTRMCMRVHGEVVLSKDRTSVRAIGDDSWITLETEDDKLHRLIITEGANGIEYAWTIDGVSKPMDAMAREWRTKMFVIMDAYRQISSIKGERASKKGQIASAKGQVASMKGRMASHKGRVASLKGQIASEKGRMASMKGQIASGRGNTAGMKGQIAGHKGHVAGMKGEIAGLKSQLRQRRSLGDDKDDKKVQELKERVKKKELEIEEYSLDKKVLALQKEMEEYAAIREQKEKELEKQIQELDMEGRVSEIRDEIKSYELDGKISDIEKEIEEYNLAERVRRIEKEIESLNTDERADEIERSIAPSLRDLKKLIQ